MAAVRIISWIARLSGLVALVLGLVFWFAQIDLITVHMAFGLLVALSLLVLSIVMLSIRGGRILGVIGVFYALIVPMFGELQLDLYISGASWLVPTVHMLIGIGAVALAQVMFTRYTRLKRASDPSALSSKSELRAAKS